MGSCLFSLNNINIATRTKFSQQVDVVALGVIHVSWGIYVDQ